MANTFFITDTTGTKKIVLRPGVLDGPQGEQTTSDLRLYGLGFHLWGEGVNENLLRLLETFASPQKEKDDYNPETEQNDYDPQNDPILPKDKNDLGPKKGINNPIEGQLWYNTTRQTLFAYDEDLGWSQVSTNTPVGQDEEPESPQEGDLWFDTDIPQLMIRRDDDWISVADRYVLLDGTSKMEGDFDLDQHKIVNLSDPEDDTDAVTKQYLDQSLGDAGTSFEDSFVNRDGDSINGVLTFNADNDSHMEVVHSNSILRIGEYQDPENGSDIRKTSDMLISADGDVSVHFADGNQFTVARGGDDRDGGFTDFLTITTDGLINVRNKYDDLTLQDNSLITQKILDEQTVSKSGGTFTGDVTIDQQLEVDGNTTLQQVTVQQADGEFFQDGNQVWDKGDTSRSGHSITVSSDAPDNPNDGDIWFELP